MVDTDCVPPQYPLSWRRQIQVSTEKSISFTRDLKDDVKRENIIQSSIEIATDAF